MPIHRCMRCMETFDTNQFSVCPYCKRPIFKAKDKGYYLNPGFVLEDKYIIGDALGSGGFGVTYLAWDTVLNAKVAIKEFLPSGYSSRDKNQVTVKSFSSSASNTSFQFEEGLCSFIDEAHKLAECGNLSGVVQVLNTFIENSTGYIVMEFLEGETLSNKFKLQGKMNYVDVIKWFIPILDSLNLIHQKGIIHSDIAPDNIMITEYGVKLIDFGASRYSSIKNNQQLSSVLKQGYSPIEQYDKASIPKPCTDIYALAASMYHMITGRLPQPSIERLTDDRLEPPQVLVPDIPPELNAVLMKAMSVQPDERYQSADEFARELKEIAKNAEPIIEGPKWTMPMKITVASLSALAAILMAVIIVFTVHNSATGDRNVSSNNNENRVVDVGGKTLSEANDLVADKDVVFVKESEEDTQQKDENGKIVPGSQHDTQLDPYAEVDELHPDFKVNKDGKVEIPVKVYVLKIKMPDLKGKTADEAKKALKDLGYKGKIKIEEADSEYDNIGKVIKVSVKKGEAIKYNKGITLTIGKKKEYTTKRYNKKKSSSAKKTTTKPKTTKPKKKSPPKSNGGSKGDIDWGFVADPNN